MSCNSRNKKRAMRVRFAEKIVAVRLLEQLGTPTPLHLLGVSLVKRGRGVRKEEGNWRPATVRVLRKAVCRPCCSSSDIRIVVIIKGET
jgi:hypothetical protein